MHLKRWLAAAICLPLLLVTAGTAEAAKSIYPDDDDAISLRNGPAGWSGSSSSEGLCVPLLLCPTITNSVPSSGGPGGSGYLRTELGGLTGVGATSVGTFTGPAFTYRGVGGDGPGDLTLQLARRADVAALLSATGNSAAYSVHLVNLSSGTDLELIGGADLAGSSGWSQVAPVAIDPSALRVGSRYRLRVSSRFESGLQILPGGSADFARIRLIARTAEDGGDGGNGGNGGNGGVKGGANLAGGVIAGTVKVKGKHLSFRVRCAKRATRKCRSRLQAKLRKRGARITSSRSVRIRPGAKRVVKLKIRKRYRKRVADRKRVVIKRKTRVAGKRRTTYRTARVRG